MGFIECVLITIALTISVVLLIQELTEIFGEVIERFRRKQLIEDDKYTVVVNYSSVEEAREILFETYTNIVRKDG